MLRQHSSRRDDDAMTTIQKKHAMREIALLRLAKTLLLSGLAVKIVKIGSILLVLVLVIELRRNLTLLIIFVMTVAHKLLLS